MKQLMLLLLSLAMLQINAQTFITQENMNQLMNVVCKNKLESYKTFALPNGDIITNLPKNGVEKNMDVRYIVRDKDVQVFVPLSNNVNDYDKIVTQIPDLIKYVQSLNCLNYQQLVNKIKADENITEWGSPFVPEMKLAVYKHRITDKETLIIFSIVKFDKSKIGNNLPNFQFGNYDFDDEDMDDDFLDKVLEKPVEPKGFGIVFDKDKLNLIAHVVYGGPAYKAGIKPKDVIIKVNNAEVASEKIFSYLASLPDSNNTLILSSNNITKSVKISKAPKKAYTNICISGNCKNGTGTFIKEDGEYYTGGFQNNKYNGAGKLYYTNGAVFSGGFKNGMPYGNGGYTYFDGSKFTGSFDSGKIVNGSGTAYFANGNKFTGTYKNRLKEGYGEFVFRKGIVYKGNFTADKFDGIGEYLFENGNKYKGQFKNDKKDGNGLFTWKNGDTYTGTFLNDVRNGHGREVYTNGDEFEGEFVNDKKHGKGTLYKNSNGKKEAIPEEWANGVKLNVRSPNYNSELNDFYTEQKFKIRNQGYTILDEGTHNNSTRMLLSGYKYIFVAFGNNITKVDCYKGDSRTPMNVPAGKYDNFITSRDLTNNSLKTVVMAQFNLEIVPPKNYGTTGISEFVKFKISTTVPEDYKWVLFWDKKN